MAGAVALLLAFSTAIQTYGQGVTTSGIAGFVHTSDGKPVVGAKVTAVLISSGTRATTSSRSDGDFSFSGMRPGGPYTVTVEGSNFTTQSQSDIMLDVGSQVRVDFAVSNDVVKLEALTVHSSRDTIFDSGAMGTSTSFNGPQVQNITSVRQDLQDLENLDPRANLQQAANGDANYTLSVQGQNPRESLFMIDGVTASDNFGLNSNGYAGLRNPVPLPWIESVAFSLDDYDIAYSGFLGGVLNTTIKSGTNAFHGSLYAMYTGTRMRGPDPVIGVLGPHEGMQVHITGADVGGPIIKDKLFFFIGYEAFREIAQPPAQFFNPVDNAADAAAVAQILAVAASKGDTNTGSFISPIHAWEQNFVTKLNWNISDSHKFEITFRHTDGFYPLTYNYTFSNETSLSGSWYSSHRIDQSYTAKFNSDWNKVIPGLTTEIEGSYRRYNGTAQLLGTDGPSALILNVNGTSSSGASPPYSLYLGPSPFYQVNQLYTSELEEHFIGEYATGQHTFKFGSTFDRVELYNAFVPNYFGTYTFSNVQDYLNGQPTGVTLAAAARGFTLSQAIAHYAQLNVAPIIQDTWKPSQRLTFTFGLRMDDPIEPARPPLSTVYLNATGKSNQTTIDGHSTVSPRFGFNYDLPTSRKTQIRGGAGLFLGAPPFVWVENSFANAGATTTYTISNSSVPIPNYTFTGNPSTQPLPPVAASVPVPTLNVLAPDYHLPANWKENLALDHQLPFWDLTLTLEVDFSQVQKDSYYTNTNLKQAPAGSGPVYMPDGAIRYAGNITPSNIGTANYAPGFTAANFYTGVSSEATPVLEANTAVGQVLQLNNTDKGASQEYTVMIHRPMKDNWAWSLAYTHTHATMVSTLGGTTASGGFGAAGFVNPNDNVAYRSSFAEPDKIVATMTRKFKFFPYKQTTTTLSAQFIAQTGVPYSYVFKGDADGSGTTGVNLFYVPTGPNDPKVTWASATEETNFFNYLAKNPDLAKYAGQIAPRNAFYAPWQKTVNLHFEQELPVYGPAHLSLFADCFNFANVLNKKWGIVSNYGVYNDQGGKQVIAGTGYNPTGNNGQGQYIYVFNPGTQSAPTIFSDQSRWLVQVGARLDF